MKTKSNFGMRRLAKLSLAIGVLATVSACTSIGYRCPLDASEKPESPTACSGMSAAMKGAKRGGGGSSSVLMDDKGRIVPTELAENRPAVPLSAKLASSNGEPYRDASGNPIFQPPKVFQVWSSSFVDANGNLHDGHSSWFSTPGQWRYGSVNKPGVVGENILKPSNPNELPAGRIVASPGARGPVQVTQQARPVQVNQAPAQAAQPTNPTAQDAQRERDKAAMQNLSNAANSAANKVNPQVQSTGVTAPAVMLND